MRVPAGAAVESAGRAAKRRGMYPIALDLRGRRVLVIGGGPVAERKALALVTAGAAVTVVAPAASGPLREAAAAGRLALAERPFTEADLEGARLAYVATDRPDVNEAAVAAARARGVLVCDASGTVAGDFSTPLTHRAGPLTFAVDTGGSSPSFTRRLLDDLAARYDERWGRAAETLARARDYAKMVLPQEYRGPVMRALAAREIDALAAMNPMVIENEVEAAYDVARGAGPSEAPAFGSVVCATRASALAMWQTRHVGGVLARTGLVSEVLQISTKGDRVQDRSLAALGTDSIFVKELETALRDGRADYAVHSCKDLPSTLPPDMRLAAVGMRADPRDAFCSERFATLDALPPGSLVGTSSPRRRAQLQALRPDLRFEPVRGNVETRLRKLRDGEFDAIVLAQAGLDRLGVRATHTVALDPSVVVPAVGQGALAVETRADDAALAARIAAAFADPHVEIAVRAERAFLRTLRGGCQAPVGAHATYDGATLAMRAIIAAPDGSSIVRGEIAERAGSVADAEAHGLALGERLLREGGEALLAGLDVVEDTLEERYDVPNDGRVKGAGTMELAQPLDGALFLLPRTQARPSSIAPALRDVGAEVVEAGSDADAEAGLGGREPSAVLFPSSGSVAAIDAWLAERRGRAIRPLVYAMGEQSAAAARAAGFEPDAVAEEASVAAFVQLVTHATIERSLT